MECCSLISHLAFQLGALFWPDQAEFEQDDGLWGLQVCAFLPFLRLRIELNPNLNRELQTDREKGCSWSRILSLFATTHSLSFQNHFMNSSMYVSEDCQPHDHEHQGMGLARSCIKPLCWQASRERRYSDGRLCDDNRRPHLVGLTKRECFFPVSNSIVVTQPTLSTR